MSEGKIMQHAEIRIDDDGSQEVPSSIKVKFAPSIFHLRGRGGYGGSTKNKYVTFFS